MEGSTFKRIRLAMGLTGDQLASSLDVTGNYIRLVESNKKPVSELLEYKIMHLFKETIASEKDPLFSIVKSILSDKTFNAYN